MLILINISVHCHQHGKELTVDKMVQLIQLAMPEAFEKNTGSASWRISVNDCSQQNSKKA